MKGTKMGWHVLFATPLPTENSTEAKVDADLKNANYYPVGEIYGLLCSAKLNGARSRSLSDECAGTHRRSPINRTQEILP